MRTHKLAFSVLFLFVSALAGSDHKPIPRILKHPRPERHMLKRLDSLPRLKPGRRVTEGIDLCSTDLRSLDLRRREGELLYADFDNRTRWPKSLPPGFDPVKAMEMGKNPGLGIRGLHQRGITGNGVGVAVIDLRLLVEHEEYRDRLVYYDEINLPGSAADMHGTATASIAVGRTTGVAPKASLYYLAVGFWTPQKGYDFSHVTEAIDRIIAFNRESPACARIRVIAMQSGWSGTMPGGREMAAAVERVKKAGIFFVSSSLIEDYGFHLNGLGREPRSDPQDPASFGPGLFWAKQFQAEYEKVMIAWAKSPRLLFPMDSRTVAGPTGKKDYVFYRVGGWSWVTPYIAGLYALACQVKPAITPEVFWETALETGDTIKMVKAQRNFKLGIIVNPAKLMERLTGKDGKDR